jgi:hypothetical protein
LWLPVASTEFDDSITLKRVFDTKPPVHSRESLHTLRLLYPCNEAIEATASLPERT